MRFEYIVLLIIAFNVVTAVMKNRAKKTRDQAARGGAGVPDSVPQNRDRTASSASYEYDEDEEEEEYQDPYAGHRPERQSPVVRSAETRGSESREGEARGSEAPVPELPSFGRDILDQLARDLGLRLPKPSAPPPAPASASTASASSARGEISRVNPVVATRAPGREAQPRTAATGMTAAKSGRSEVTRSRTGIGASPLRDSLLGKDRLREAFVLKEILDLPLSRRARR
jgi:hypothetical protein